MAFETALEPASRSSRFSQDVDRYRTPPPYLNVMTRFTDSNESSENEGFMSSSSRSNTETASVDLRYPTSNAINVNSLRPTSATGYVSTTKYISSRPYPSSGECSSSISSNVNASEISLGDYTTTPNLFQDLHSDFFFEPEPVDVDPSYKAPNASEFSHLYSLWTPLNSLQNTGSKNNGYLTDFDLWEAPTLPWSGISAEYLAREVSDSQTQYHGAVVKKNEIDSLPPSQQTQEQAKDASTLRCQEIGCGKSFSRPADLRRHHRELHDPRGKRFFCGCCNTKPDGFKREEKLINHKVKFHGFARASKLRTCHECDKINDLDVFYFCSDDAIKIHKELAHGVHSVADNSTGRNDSRSGTLNDTKTQSLSDENNSDKMLPVSASKCSKRELQTGKESTAKRAKIDLHIPENNVQPAENESTKRLDQISDDHMGPFKWKDENTNSAAGEILVSDVGISEFYALSKNKVIRAMEEEIKLGSAGGPAKPEISFNAFQGSIRLRGFGNVTTALQSIVRNLLEKQERLGSSLKEFTSLNLLRMRSKLDRVPQPQPTRVKIFAMRQAEDAVLLKVWHEKIIPTLPELLAKTIGDNYSASLVRKGISELSGTAVIQIQTHTLPSRTVRALIRNRIVHLVNKDISLRSNQVQFLKGRLTTLAGELHKLNDIGESLKQSDQVSEDNDEPECYPFYKRYWRTPGPGASIGLLCTGSIAATICCYIHIDGRLFILTVKHFITKSYDHLLTGISDRTTVVSPALADVDDMREKFTQFVTDFKIELDEAMRDHFEDEYPEYISFGDINSLPDHVQDIMAKLDVVRKDLSHLTGGDKPFRLGSLAYQSAPPSDLEPPLLSHPNQKYGHHMDWAVCSVDPERAGTNRHRYMYNHEEQAVDFYSGDTDTSGAGQPFLGTCTIEPNTKVHFVGQATGRQSGEINAARILVRNDGVLSEEWAMLVQASERDSSDMIHKGDSGASVIRDCDNKLAGLLWARTKNGHLLVSPIDTVLDDIRLKVPASNVSLPPIDQDPPTGASISISVHDLDTICRDKTVERPRLRRQFRSLDMPSPRRKHMPSLSNKETMSPQKNQLPAIKSLSLPVPLKNSQWHPVFDQPNTAVRPLLPPPECFGLAQQLFRTLEDNKSKHSVGFILTGYSNKKSENRSTFLKIQDKVLKRAGTWPGKNHPRFTSHNAEALNAVFVN